MRYQLSRFVLVPFTVGEQVVNVPVQRPDTPRWGGGYSEETYYLHEALSKLRQEIGIGEYVSSRIDLAAWEGRGKDPTKK